MYLIGVDVGTTHSKAGLFREDGTCVHVARRETPTRWDPDGPETYDPEELWSAVSGAVHEAAEKVPGGNIAVVGIASQAETGVLLDRRSGAPRYPFVPWFDATSAAQATLLAKEDDPFSRFQKSGLRANRKVGLAKILWLKQRDPRLVQDAVWLSVSDYIAWRLTGVQGTDYTLAGRTFAYRMDTLEWDADWICHLGLDPSMFPHVAASGTTLGDTRGPGAEQAGLRAGVPVAVSGHDHVLAALAVGVVQPGRVLNSMGTAETLVGVVDAKPLTRAQFDSSLSFGRHISPGRLFWMGGPPSSGASVEWIRTRLADPPLSYADIERLVGEAGPEPTGILYYPYLAGCAAPWPEPRMRAAFIGLDDEHTRAHIVKAVLEGTAYELEAVRRAAVEATGVNTDVIRAVGGGTLNHSWMRIKADVSGCDYDAPDIPEAAALGAAIAAGIGAGIYPDVDAAVRAVGNGISADHYSPDPARHDAYRRVYEQGYQPLHDALRATAIALGDMARQ
ncbi:MAG TPA: FGGY-family carbohydrate kinase [Armatimonadota bacterium]|jgi:xylulokinase